jgi:hypothetical protein
MPGETNDIGKNKPLIKKVCETKRRITMKVEFSSKAQKIYLQVVKICSDFLSKTQKIYLQAIGNGGEDKKVVIGILIGCLAITFIVGVVVGSSFGSSASDGSSVKSKGSFNKKFEGNYEFLITHMTPMSLFSETPDMGLAPITIKIMKGSNGDYKGQMTITTLIGNYGWGFQSDTTEHTYELENLMPSKDTLNFLISAMYSPNINFSLVKGKPNHLYISRLLFDENFFGGGIIGPVFFEKCSDANPAFVKQIGRMLVFKELKMNNIQAEKQMNEMLRACK